MRLALIIKSTYHHALDGPVKVNARKSGCGPTAANHARRPTKMMLNIRKIVPAGPNQESATKIRTGCGIIAVNHAERGVRLSSLEYFFSTADKMYRLLFTFVSRATEK